MKEKWENRTIETLLLPRRSSLLWPYRPARSLRFESTDSEKFWLVIEAFGKQDRG